MLPHLPTEIIHAILEQANAQGHHSTLFQCALASRGLAGPALSRLWQLPHIFSEVGITAELDGTPVFTRKKDIMPLLWKTLLASTLPNTTYLAYSTYVQYLDLNTLRDAFTLNGLFQEEFRTGCLKPFLPTTHPAATNPKLRIPDEVFDQLVIAILSASGRIKELSCDYSTSPETLEKWLPHVPRLNSLTVDTGNSLEGMEDSLGKHCPELKKLVAVLWYDDIDERNPRPVTTFMSKLRPNMLHHFEIGAQALLVPGTLLAITSQWDSLITLKLRNSGECLVNVLVKQAPPPKLQCLALHECGRVRDDLNLSTSDEFDMIEDFQLSLGLWIGSCRSLRRLEVSHATVGSSLLITALESPGLSLEALSILGESAESEYRLQDSDRFFNALASHSSLQELIILAAVGRKTKILLESVQKLSNLRLLYIDKATTKLKPRQVGTLTSSLPHLKELSICNSQLDDQLWDHLHIPNLRHLNLGTPRKIRKGCTHKFTGEGIINWVRRLGPGNQGFRLEILAPFDQSTLEPEECEAVEKELIQRLDGSFRSSRMGSLPRAW